MATYVERLLAERARAWEEAKALLDHASDEKRELSAEEEAKYQRITADINTIAQRANKLVEDENSSKAAEESLRSLMGGKKVETADSTEDSSIKDLRSFFKGERRELIIPPNIAEMRALSKATNAAGAYTVPTSFYGQLWLHLIQTANLINAGATVLTTNSGENLQIPVTLTHGAAAAVAENATIAGTDPTFGQRQVGAFKFGQLITVSRELIEDEGVDITAYLAKIVGWNLGNAFGQKLVIGAGTTEPAGITLNSSLGVTSATAQTGGLTAASEFDQLIDLFHSVIPQYRNQPSAAWLMNDTTAAAIRKVKTTGTGAYIWQPSVVVGLPDTILSKPVYVDPYMPSFGLNNKSILFGDMSAYMVRVVNGVRFESSTEYAFASDQITFRAIMRGDGLLIDQTGAVKHFLGAAS